MRPLFTLHDIRISDQGKRIDYDYSFSDALNPFLKKDANLYVYYENTCPETSYAYAVIPLLANIVPLSWFLDFEIQIDTIDSTLLSSFGQIKKEFQRSHPHKTLGGSLKFQREVEQQVSGTEKAMLFSGGLDSYDTLCRNISSDPYLVSVLGADIDRKDHKRWKEFKSFNESEKILHTNRSVYIETNFREFYTPRIHEILGTDWWGIAQHGMAFLGLLAPLTPVLNLKEVLIASSGHQGVDYAWGSKPAIDENFRWSDVRVVHDGYAFSRIEKAENIIHYCQKENIAFHLRVCYSEGRINANCNECHKCLRTILSLILYGADPLDYGLQVPALFGKRLLSNFYPGMKLSKGILYQWECLQELAITHKERLINYPGIELSEKQYQKFISADLNKLNQNTNVPLQWAVWIRRKAGSHIRLRIKWFKQKLNYATN